MWWAEGTGTKTRRGGEQLAICGGGAVYVLDLETNVLTGPIALPLTNAAVQIEMIDGYCLLLEADTVDSQNAQLLPVSHEIPPSHQDPAPAAPPELIVSAEAQMTPSCARTPQL